MTAPVDQLWRNARIATLAPGTAGYGMIEGGALALRGDTLAWIGPDVAARALPRSADCSEFDCAGRLITPGLVDCHTHLVHAGNRAEEFERRLAGASYEQLAAAGGGIQATVAATRAATLEQLLEQSAPRLRRLLAEGVTTVEVKSGYGLDRDSELRMLRAARALARDHPVTVHATCLAAHAVPPEFAGRADDYLARVCDDILPAVAAEALADSVDAFCERIAFDPDQLRRVFRTARALQLPVRLHADQLSDGGGAQLAAEFGALSADHLEYAGEAGVRALAAAGSVAVLLPGAFYTLRQRRAPPVALMRRHGLAMAVATDCNPGSSPLTSLLLAMNMACTLFGLSVEEALAGVTRNAARALGLAEVLGSLEAGKRGDFVLWDLGTPAELVYRIGDNPCLCVVRGGAAVRGEPPR